ncbi:MAG: DNA polymerase II [Chitinispirillaceae bacterium]|nr:DNA polymerase II [Chitinispirillaceae bacterium]
MDTRPAQTCFLIYDDSGDRNGRFEMRLYGVNDHRVPVVILIDTFRPLFFVPRTTPHAATVLAAERKALPLVSLSNGEPVDCLYFSTYRAFRECGSTLRERSYTVYESDVHPRARYLMERFVTGSFRATGEWKKEGSRLFCRNPRIRGTPMRPQLGIMSLDIETNVHSGEIVSIACAGVRDAVFVRGTGDSAQAPPITFCRDEKTLLECFFNHLCREDPDGIIGWNIVDFDLWTIQLRCTALHIPFAAGRAEGANISVSPRDGRRTARVPGRAIIDVPSTLRAYYHPFEEYSLDFVADALLGKHKSIRKTGQEKIEEINRMYRENPRALGDYNLLDARLTKEIFERADLLPNMIERSQHSGHRIDRTGGSVAAFDHLYLPRLHRQGYVAGDSADVVTPATPLPGGHVLEPVPGLYENVLVLDFRSLYPSLIMTFNIDPLGLAAPSRQRTRGPEGPSFASDKTILPSIIAELLEARAKAKRENNPYLSQAIKILMNSFYGVLGAPGCRFFSADLAATITKTGQYILKKTIAHIEERARCPVIYGDTDSLFVHLGPGRENDAAAFGNTLATEETGWLARMLTETFGVRSALLLQFEEHFRYMFMPPLRGSTQGSKKHYCGAVADGPSLTLVFKGMESARSDWTELAKEFQHELYRKFFSKEPVEQFIMHTIDMVRTGGADPKLVYKKRLRKRIEEYTDHLPPHVQAARQLEKPPHVVRYYQTVNGPQPLEKRLSALDYDHYIESQIRPVAEPVLQFLQTSFDRIVSGQQELFI